MTVPHVPSQLPPGSAGFALPPTVDASQPIPLSPTERLVIALPAAAMAVSVAIGNLPSLRVAGAIFGLASLLIITRGDRSLRRNCMRIAPHLDWAEYHSVEQRSSDRLKQGVVWLLIYAMSMGALLWGPKEGALAFITWLSIGILTLVLVFFLPGFSSRQLAEQPQEDQGQELSGA